MFPRQEYEYINNEPRSVGEFTPVEQEPSPGYVSIRRVSQMNQTLAAGGALGSLEEELQVRENTATLHYIL